MKKFKMLSMCTSALCFYLFCSFLFAPQSFLADLGIEGTETAYFVGRRASMLMLGFSVLLFLGRNTAHSPARQAIALSICVAMLGLSLTGIYEFTRGFVANGILIPIAVELVLAASYFYIWLTSRQVGALQR
jgi:hypothetical protein